MVEDSKRRAADALVEAFEDGFTMREVIDLAMDDATASEHVHQYILRVHDCYHRD